MSECVKMKYSVRNQKHDVDGGFSCFWCVWTKGHVWHQEYVWRHRCSMTTKNNILCTGAFLTLCLWGQKRPGQIRLLCVFGVLFRSAHTLPRMTAGLHLHVSTYRYMSKDWSVVLHTLWNHGQNLSESFVMSLFVRCTVWSSVLVLNTRCSAAAAGHKSWSSWLCSRNPSPPSRYEAGRRRGVTFLLLLLINKARAKDKNYIWVSVRWKTKN